MLLWAADGQGLPHDIGQPALTPLRARVQAGVRPLSSRMGLAAEPGQLDVDPSMAGRPGALVLLRFGLELACLRTVPGLPHAAATLLAGRAAGLFLTVLPGAARDRALSDAAIPLLRRLAGPLPPIAQLAACWRLLAEAMASEEPAPDLAALEMVARLWDLAAPTEALLVSGGDDRLTLDPQTGLNRYLCPPYPMPGVISFSSCTASIISPPAFAAPKPYART